MALALRVFGRAARGDLLAAGRARAGMTMTSNIPSYVSSSCTRMKVDKGAVSELIYAVMICSNNLIPTRPVPSSQRRDSRDARCAPLAHRHGHWQGHRSPRARRVAAASWPIEHCPAPRAGIAPATFPAHYTLGANCFWANASHRPLSRTRTQSRYVRVTEGVDGKAAQESMTN